MKKLDIKTIMLILKRIADTVIDISDIKSSGVNSADHSDDK